MTVFLIVCYFPVALLVLLSIATDDDTFMSEYPVLSVLAAPLVVVVLLLILGAKAISEIKWFCESVVYTVKRFVRIK